MSSMASNTPQAEQIRVLLSVREIAGAYSGITPVIQRGQVLTVVVPISL